MDLRQRVVAAVRSGMSRRQAAARFDVARRRIQWRWPQGKIDPTRLIFIDETWAKTNMATAALPAAPCQGAGTACD